MNVPMTTRAADLAVRMRHSAGLEAAAVWRPMPGALLLLGQTQGSPPPEAGMAQIAGQPASRGAFRALSWPIDGQSGHTFLLAVRCAGRTDPADGETLMLRGAAGGAWSLSLPSEPFGQGPGDAGFGQFLARAAGAEAAAVAGFLLDTLRPPPDRDVPKAGTMLRAFLSQAAQPDGVIEITATAPEGCVLLQGWGAAIHGAVQVVLAGAALPFFAGHAGGFARADIVPPASGVMLVLPGEAAGSLSGLEHVFVLSEAGLHSRSLVGQRVLDPGESLGHIRHMLPSLRGPAPMLSLLRETLRPRFDGRDTLTGNEHPVRAAFDCVLAAPGVGVYLSGWVYDPANTLASVHLCGASGYAARLDGRWTRVLRPDVVEAYRREPAFAGQMEPEAGVVVFVPQAPGAGEALHLRFTFADGDRAFMPVTAADPAQSAVRARLLAGIDLYKPSGIAIVEQHAAPLLARVRPAAVPPPRVWLAGPMQRPKAVVAALAATTTPRALLSGFLHDPLEPDEHLVLICGPEWGQPGLDALRDLVGFYGLPASILVTTETAGPMLALRAAASVTRSASLLLVGAGVGGRSPGWRQALRATLDRNPGAAFVCPTLLSEDWSIRYAGSAGLRLQDAAPYASLDAPLAGLPAGLAADAAPRPAVIGSLECCLLRRQALAALDGDGAHSTDAGREAGFFMRLRAAGLSGVWAPDVRVYAPEGADMAEPPVARLIDGWMLRDAWRGAKEA
jgi:hypothetical protein